MEPVQDIEETLAGDNVGPFDAVGYQRVDDDVPG